MQGLFRFLDVHRTKPFLLGEIMENRKTYKIEVTTDELDAIIRGLKISVDEIQFINLIAELEVILKNG